MVQKTVMFKTRSHSSIQFGHCSMDKPAQKLFKDEDLPKGEEKRQLYEISRELLLEAGYVEIGMDHFSLPTDALTHASRENRLHRNFMGYTDRRTQVMLGLGVSSISETPECFHQNEKTLPVYENASRAVKFHSSRAYFEFRRSHSSRTNFKVHDRRRSAIG